MIIIGKIEICLNIKINGFEKNKIYRKNLNKDISIPSKILNEINELNAIK